jgi:hypothetical protein
MYCEGNYPCYNGVNLLEETILVRVLLTCYPAVLSW